MLSSTQKQELSKLRILQYLSDSPLAKDGILLDYLPRPERGSPKRLALEMVDEGLIERRQDPHLTKPTKPCFITDAGRQYLEAAQKKAMFPEIMPRQDWSAGETGPDTQQTVADFIRTLPEFSKSHDRRIQEVSQKLAQIIAPSAAKGA
jgi:DNA-binding MarR family transcriptional regulator